MAGRPRTLEDFLELCATEDPDPRRAAFTREALAQHARLEGPSRFEHYCATCRDEEYPCEALREAAAPYRDDPRFDRRWAPRGWTTW